MSMRYVRGGSTRPQSKPQTGRGTGGGRFSGRGRFSHSFEWTNSHANKKWVRAAGAVGDTDDNDEGGSIEVSNVRSNMPGSDATDHGGVVDDFVMNPTHDRATDEQSSSKPLKIDEEQVPHPTNDNEDLEKTDSSHQRLESSQSDTNEQMNSSPQVNQDEPVSSQTLQRRGKHKLVLKKDNPSKRETNNDAGLKADSFTISSSHTQVNARSNETMLRRGHRKLVLKRNATEEEPEQNVTKLATDTNNLSTRSKTSLTWSRQPPKQTCKAEDRSSSGNKNSKKDPGADADFARKKKRQKTNFDTPTRGSRRICLKTNVPSTEAEDSTTDKLDTGARQPNEDGPVENTATTNKTLTDFRYRDTGRGAAFGGRRKSAHSTRSGNMGLVRVKPENPSATAICPTFRRGLQCNNPKCTLRHDVASESSRPLCVFFQRNGMCSKGDACQFRHVKVRWDAEVCPMFEKVGYCENPDCMLRHAVIRKSKEG